MALHDFFRQVMAIDEEEKREKLSKERWAFQLVTKAIPKKIKALPFVEPDRYIVKGSVGQGVWTDVP